MSDGRALLIEVHLLDRRWHGVGDWPPSPFRLFQALVAGAYGGRWRSEDDGDKDTAFRWLEKQPAPVIAAPPKAETQPTTYFVPNNDLDALGGDPRRVADIRTAKTMQPVLIEGDRPFLYLWRFDEGEAEAGRIAHLAGRLHTFGRGLDAAFARGGVLDADAANALLMAHGRMLSTPNSDGGDRRLPWAMEGSLDSLKSRHADSAVRFERKRHGRSVEVRFRQPRKALFRPVAYDRPPTRLLFELRPLNDDRPFASRPQEKATSVTLAVRDVIERRLEAQHASAVERFVVGRDAGPRDAVRRVRIVPLPTIGHAQADPAIRRVLIEIPPDCPLPAADIAWAVSGQELADPETGSLPGIILVPTDDTRMLRHYGVPPAADEAGFWRWRTVTPCALPEARPRGRTAALRMASDDRAAAAVADALRHAEVRSQAVSLRIQSEPFHAKGARAEAFEPGRFELRRLRHVELTFAEPVTGPLVIGDGRWQGLGVMRPVRLAPPGFHLFRIDPRDAPAADLAIPLARALRRAVMARAGAAALRLSRGGALPVLFTGHAPDGSPARSGKHVHLFFLCDDFDGDGKVDRLAVVAPDLVDRTAGFSRADLAAARRLLEGACAGLVYLRAGRAGAMQLYPAEATQHDPLFGAARTWTSRTPYRPTRHRRKSDDPELFVAADLADECLRRGLPRPRVDIVDLTVGPKGGMSVLARLRFQVAIRGPVLLGADSHFGAGLFAGS